MGLRKVLRTINDAFADAMLAERLIAEGGRRRLPHPEALRGFRTLSSRYADRVERRATSMNWVAIARGAPLA